LFSPFFDLRSRKAKAAGHTINSCIRRLVLHHAILFVEVLPFYIYYTEANAKMAIFDHFCI
jgi:hypothetical protein